MNKVDREGHYRAIITSYGLHEAESGSLAINITASLTNYWNTTEWIDWPAGEMEADGAIWIVKKDGSLNDTGVQSLMRHAGWDGNLTSIDDQTWQPTPIAVTIQEDTYKDQTRLRIAFLNDYERTPGAKSNVTGDKVRELQNKFGGALRAIAGNVGRVKAPASGKPSAPPLSNGNGKQTREEAWTLDRALSECAKVGITKDDLRSALAAEGINGWNMLRGTPIAKMLIANRLAPAPGGLGDDIPF